MTWRGRSNWQDRILACLPYILPLMEAYPFGLFLLAQWPILATLYVPLYPIMLFYGYLGQFIPFLNFVVFFALYLLVVRNENILHLIRFNTAQALLLSISLDLFNALFKLLGIVQGGVGADIPMFWGVIFTTIFLGVVSSSLYSIVQVIRGLYAEIPIVSEAAYAIVRGR